MPKLVLSELKGIDANKASFQMAPGEPQFSQNVWTRPFKNWAKRRGVEPVAEQSGPYFGIFELDLDNIVIPITANAGILTFFPNVASSSLNNVNPNPYGLNNPAGPLDPDEVDVIVKSGPTGSTGCSYSGDFSPFNLTYEQTDITFSVTAPSGCSWKATSGAGWLTPQLGDVHLAGGSATFRASRNTGADRSTTITIAKFTDGTGGTIGTITVNQSAEAVPGSCPGHPPLLDQYTLDSITFSGGQLSLYGCTYSPPLNTGKPATGDPSTSSSIILNKVSDCYWLNNPGSDPVSIVKLRLVAGSWELTFEIHYWVDESGGVDNYTGLAFRKAFGSTPIGTYTRTSSCLPTTITVS